MIKFLNAFLIVILLSSCAQLQLPFEVRQIIKRVQPELKQHQVYVGDPVFIRIFKEENILELWMKPENQSKYTLVKTYPMCNWSGRLGPKFVEGDHQSPEGFYATNIQNLNPNSQYHLSFNIQYPNEYDRSQGRTGSYIMVHGDCVSKGCYAITDDQIEEIYILTEKAIQYGQRDVPVHVFPFKMTDERLRLEFTSPHYYFWRNLQTGYNFFETHKVPPLWTVKNNQYEFY